LFAAPVVRADEPATAAPAAPKFPFAATVAKRYQREYAEWAKLPVELTNALGMTFVLVPPGTFWMGSPDEE